MKTKSTYTMLTALAENLSEEQADFNGHLYAIYRFGVELRDYYNNESKDKKPISQNYIQAALEAEEAFNEELKRCNCPCKWEGGLPLDDESAHILLLIVRHRIITAFMEHYEVTLHIFWDKMSYVKLKESDSDATDER